MSRRNQAHDMVMESLTEALLQLMRAKPLAEVSVSELCDKAGVSRVSFYRNFTSMDDILVQHLTRCTDAWWAEFSLRSEADFYLDFCPALLTEYRKNRNLILLIYQNERSYLLKEHIFTCCGVNDCADEREAYLRAGLAGALYGLVDEWIKRGMGEFPEGFSLHKLRFDKPED